MIINNEIENRHPDKENIKYMLYLLKSGEEHIKLPGYKNIVLILGNTGAGKSTFAQFIAGNNDDLESIEVSEGSGDFIIKDKDNKISNNSTIISKTLYPDLFINEKTGTYFYDCPGFSDTRSTAHDISSTYFTKKVIDSSKEVKLIFVVNYPSVRTGVDRKDFILLVKHITTLLKDIDKFKDSIALVVTKVDNQFIKRKGEIQLVPDEKVIIGIAEFLKIVREDIKTQAKIPSVRSDDNKEFSQKALKLIDVFLANEGGIYTRIGLFRRPDEPGQLSKSPLLQMGKETLEYIIYNNINYIKKKENDFGFTISPESKNYVHDLADEINNNLHLEVSSIGLQIRKYSIRDEGNSRDISLLHKKFKLGIDILSKYDSPDSSLRFIKQTFKDIKALDTNVAPESLLNIMHFDDYLTFLEHVGGKALKNPLQWSQGFIQLMKYFNNSKKWYAFLIDLDDWLSDYIVQKHRFDFKITKLVQQCSIEEGKEISVEQLDLQQLLSDLQIHKVGLNIENAYNDIKELPVEHTKLRILRHIIFSTINHKTEIECVGPNKLVIKGNFVNLNDITMKQCKENIQYIDIYASNKIFIDSDLNKIGNKLQLTIIAPIWEIIGNIYIRLEGKQGGPQSPALNGYGFSSDGETGNSGTVGGSGGNFFGIANQVVGGSLYVSVDGGQGGPGQDGGNGSGGRNGRNPNPARDSATRTVFNQWGPEYDWENEGINWEYTGKWERVLVAWYYYKAKGTSASNGGNGGNGGVGGIGGKAGTFKMIDLSNSGKITGSSKEGARGYGGKGGRGGVGAKNGVISKAHCRIDRFIVVAVTYCSTVGTEDNGRSEPGRDGHGGWNSYAIEHPEEALKLLRPLQSVNSYKNFLRETLTQSTKTFALTNFISDLDTNEIINGLYDTLGLINELEGLENQFSMLNGNVDMLPFYQSLLNRIDNYAMNPKKDEKTNEYKKVIVYLYTATLSKISSFDKKHNDGLIVDIPLFLDLVVKNINKLNVIQSNVAINEVTVNYKKGIEEQVKSARDSIKKNIIPELNSIFDGIDTEIELLVNETLSIINNEDQKKGELIRKQEKLENSILLKYLLGPIKMISEYLNLNTPFVEEMTKTALDRIGTVSKHLSINDHESKSPSVFTLLTALSGIINPSFQRINDISVSSRGLLNTQLEDMALGMTKYLETHKNSSLYDIQGILIDTKQRLENDLPEDGINDHALVNNMRTELAKLLENQKGSLEGMKHSNGDDDLKQIDENQKILDINGISGEYYNEIKNDQRQINLIGDSIKNINKKIKVLQTFERNIYRIIVPSCRQLKKTISITQSDLNDKSFAEIEMSKLEMKSVLNDIKFEIRQLTKGINVGEELTRCFEKIDETLSIIFNIYTRLDDFYEKTKLAAYIADINSQKSLQIRVSDHNLQSALNLLELSIKSNLLLEQYHKAMEAFIQAVFPFANLYMNEYNMPSSFNLEKKLNSLTFIAEQKLDTLKTKLLESTASVNKYDIYIHSNIQFTSGHVSSAPFFVWKSELNKGTIGKLLEGFEVNLKADIMKGRKLDAVKFKEIGIKFRVENQTLQNELNKKLDNFEVMMIHHGYSYYECGNEYYVITSEKQTFRFHMKKDAHNNPINRNLVYDKIKMGNYLLSPYTMWTIKLIHPYDNFRSLYKYMKENIDLELVGVGQYIEKGKIDIEVCNKDLAAHYQVDESISEVNSIYRYLEDQSENITTEIHLSSRRRKRQYNYNNTHETSYPMFTSGSSYGKSSPINYIVNTLLTGVTFIKYFNPFNKVTKWISLGEQNKFSDETNEYAQSYKLDGKLINVWANDFILTDNISDKKTDTNKLTDNSILNSAENLLLWNVFLRKFNKDDGKAKSTIHKPQYYDINDHYSHSLAYSHYSNKNVCHEKKSSDFNVHCSYDENSEFMKGKFNEIGHSSQLDNTRYIDEISSTIPLID